MKLGKNVVFSLVSTFIKWVFGIESVLGHIGQIVAL